MVIPVARGQIQVPFLWTAESEQERQISTLVSAYAEGPIKCVHAWLPLHHLGFQVGEGCNFSDPQTYFPCYFVRNPVANIAVRLIAVDGQACDWPDPVPSLDTSLPRHG